MIPIRDALSPLSEIYVARRCSEISFHGVPKRLPARALQQRNLAQLLFHAKNDGFEFTAEEMAEVVGKLEANVILNKDKEKFDGSSRLWRQMWGTCHLDYVVIHLFARHTADEIQNLFPGMK